MLLSFLLPSCLLGPALAHASLGERELQTLSSSQIASLVAAPDPLKNIDPFDPGSHLARILIPRAPETDNNTRVRSYLKQTLQDLDWHIEEDTFTDKTPYGTKRFTNLIATKDPKASRRVVLSAHFDSKYFPSYPNNQFVGATDSAAPCAMMLDLAQTLNPLLEARRKEIEDGDDDEDTTLQLVFFDGEEAFQQWTNTDSIYGARHLAEKWSSTYIAPHSKRRLVGPSATEISTVEHLILLDLLGAANPQIRSYFTDTAWLFDAMVSAERRLGDSGHFEYDGSDSMSADKWQSFFRPRVGTLRNNGHIGDDHVPFLNKGVSVLHVIAEPFPHVWHSLKDDASALDIPTMRRWNLILRVFMSEYLGLKPDAAKQSADIRRSQSEL
ncbi:hypothetical protein CYLTODRAFT_387176 [Cylindrobasidium torrendii FP15055 ss-10]|uniref:Peptide hydrolase n=1 Tax=Cylindrobasidium torrendii FP15055 ss-10 TaxID=1314674 RepID=A0A0D7BSG9_9AGAR|nr:hypothetical protein CYLTODRAFT_387176 [Cylindrobasidium torrendii FP15055 ss-10]